MTTLTTAAEQTPEQTPALTVTAVPATLPPLDSVAGSGLGLASRETRSQQHPAWAPRQRPLDETTMTERAQAEHRREEERHVRSLARIVALACVEAELGLRSARQLSAWLDLATYQKMIRRADLAQRIRATRSDGPSAAPKALGARACRLGQNAYEASATVQMPDRARAMALRIEKHRNRWKVTALELG